MKRKIVIILITIGVILGLLQNISTEKAYAKECKTRRNYYFFVEINYEDTYRSMDFPYTSEYETSFLINNIDNIQKSGIITLSKTGNNSDNQWTLEKFYNYYKLSKANSGNYVGEENGIETSYIIHGEVNENGEQVGTVDFSDEDINTLVNASILGGTTISISPDYEKSMINATVSRELKFESIFLGPTPFTKDLGSGAKDALLTPALYYIEYQECEEEQELKQCDGNKDLKLTCENGTFDSDCIMEIPVQVRLTMPEDYPTGKLCVPYDETEMFKLEATVIAQIIIHQHGEIKYLGDAAANGVENVKTVNSGTGFNTTGYVNELDGEAGIVYENKLSWELLGIKSDNNDVVYDNNGNIETYRPVKYYVLKLNSSSINDYDIDEYNRIKNQCMIAGGISFNAYYSGIERYGEYYNIYGCSKDELPMINLWISRGDSNGNCTKNNLLSYSSDGNDPYLNYNLGGVGDFYEVPKYLIDNYNNPNSTYIYDIGDDIEDSIEEQIADAVSPRVLNVETDLPKVRLPDSNDENGGYQDNIGHWEEDPNNDAALDNALEEKNIDGNIKKVLKANTEVVTRYYYIPNNAYINKKTAKVVYSDNDTDYNNNEYLQEGKKYFVPMKYSGFFPMQALMDSGNLSTLNGITWRADYACGVSSYCDFYECPGPSNPDDPDIPWKDLTTPQPLPTGYRFYYRPISLSEVFPNGRVEGSNWTFWREENGNKFENTYDNLEYQVTLTSDDIQSIVEYNEGKNYLKFDNINGFGSSNFIGMYGNWRDLNPQYRELGR